MIKMANWIVKERTTDWNGNKTKKRDKFVDTFNAKDLDSARRILYDMVRYNQDRVNDMNGTWFVLFKVNPNGYTEMGEATGDGMSMLWYSSKTKGDSYLYRDGTIGKYDREGPKW